MYPKVRVFISSTFLDMEKERDVLSLEVFPRIEGICNKRGVAFSMIDLRWGIREEDVANGHVLQLCLEEVQHCKPYFVGIIGNRYGTIIDGIDRDLIQQFPFIQDNVHKSVTELEMILGALSEENRDRCFFYYKDPILFDSATSDDHDGDIEDLKKRIDRLKIRHSPYSSLDEFNQTVEKDLVNAIESDFPPDMDITDVIQEAYLRINEFKYVERPNWEKKIAEVINLAEQSHVAIVALSTSPLGKTASFNHLINSKSDVDKIIINLEADINMRYYPSHYIFNIICDGLYDLGYNLEESEEFPEPDSLNNYESSILAMLSVLKKTLYSITFCKPLYILINDVKIFDKLDVSRAFAYSFLFDKSRLPDNLFVIITTNQKQWEEITYYEMTPDEENPLVFLQNYLGRYGKQLDQEILESCNPLLKMWELELVAEYLVHYCNFSSYKTVAQELLSKASFLDILSWIYDRFVSEMTPKCASVFTEILVRLFVYRPGLPEQSIFDSYKKETALEHTEYQIYVDLIGLEKAAIMRALRFFTNVESGTVFLSNPCVQYFVKQYFDHMLDVLSRTNSARTRKACEDFFAKFPAPTTVDINRDGVMEKNAFIDKVSKDNGSKALLYYGIFDPLCICIDKRITAYIEDLKESETAFDPEYLTEQEVSILVAIQEAAELYRVNTREDLFSKLLGCIELMLFISAKSHSLLKKLFVDYIELQVYVHKTQFSHVDYNVISFSLSYTLEAIINADRKVYSEMLIDSVIGIAIGVLEEYNILDYKLLELAKQGEGTFSTSDFVINACSNDAHNGAHKLDYLCDYGNNNDIIRMIPDLYSRYNESTNSFNKTLYADFIFRISARLIDEDAMPDDIFHGIVTNCIKDMYELRHYCFFNEISSVIDDFISRFTLRTESGTHLLV